MESLYQHGPDDGWCFYFKKVGLNRKLKTSQCKTHFEQFLMEVSNEIHFKKPEEKYILADHVNTLAFKLG